MTIKQAEDPRTRVMAERLKNILVGFGGGGMAAGATIAGIQGLNGVVSRSFSEPPKVPIRQQFVEIPIARRKHEDDGPLTSLAKAAAAVAGPAPVVPPPSATTSGLMKVLDLFGASNPNNAKWFNPGANAIKEHPWGIPAAVGAAAGGGMLGYGLANKAIGKAHTHEDDAELEDAKQRYERALGGKLAGAKLAASDPYVALDRIWDKLEKTASSIGNDLGTVGGLAATGLGTLSLISGIGAYNWVRGHAQDKAIETAMRQRRAQLFTASPPPLVAVPREQDADPADEPTPVDIDAIKASIRAARAPKSAALSPAAAGQSAMSRINATAEAARRRARTALGIEEEAAPPPAPPAPHRPPSVIAQPAQPAAKQ